VYRLYSQLFYLHSVSATKKPISLWCTRGEKNRCLFWDP